MPSVLILDCRLFATHDSMSERWLLSFRNLSPGKVDRAGFFISFVNLLVRLMVCYATLLGGVVRLQLASAR